MKKVIIFLLVSALFNTASTAQTKDVKKDQTVLKNTVKDKKEDKHEVGKDLAHLRLKKAVKERKEVKHHRKSIHKQGKHLKNNGVKHPIKTAKDKAKVDKDIKN